MLYVTGISFQPTHHNFFAMGIKGLQTKLWQLSCSEAIVNIVHRIHRAVRCRHDDQIVYATSGRGSGEPRATAKDNKPCY